MNKDDKRKWQQELADEARTGSKSKSPNLPNSRSNNTQDTIPFLVAFALGALVGLFACTSLFGMAQFAEQFGNFSNTIAAIAGPLIGGFFGVLIKLMIQKK